MNKIYYQLTMVLGAPLRIGSVDSIITDSDLITDVRGLPVIPGSSLAGVLRELTDEKDRNRIFGYIKGDELYESKVMVSDGVLSKNTRNDYVRISKRDGVELDDWGITIKKHKYDFQVVETKEPFVSIIECEDIEPDIESVMDSVVSGLVKNGLLIGAKTTRGYGKLSVVAKKRVFSFPDDLTMWLDFDPFEYDKFNGTSVNEGVSSKKKICISVVFKVVDGLNIRVKTTDYEEMEDGTKPDSRPLLNIDEKPVIPGTAWAGVFRHHMREIILSCGYGKEEMEQKLKNLDLLFGKNEKDDDHLKSDIMFSESVIEDTKSLVITRNAIDRFTQAPRNTAVFTNMICQNGKGRLEISLNTVGLTDFNKRLLEISLIDLDKGIMAVGGETGVGRGRLSLDHVYVNDSECTDKVHDSKSGFLEVL